MSREAPQDPFVVRNLDTGEVYSLDDANENAQITPLSSDELFVFFLSLALSFSVFSPIMFCPFLPPCLASVIHILVLSP